MPNLEQITLGELVTAAAFITLLVTYIKNALKPLNDFTKRIDDIEAHQDNDNKRLKQLEEETRLILKATLVLVKHGEDNNHTGELAQMEKNINEYLLNK